MAGPPGLSYWERGGPLVGAASGFSPRQLLGPSAEGGPRFCGTQSAEGDQRSPAADCAEQTGAAENLGAGNLVSRKRASDGRVEDGINPGPGRDEQ